MGLSCNFNLHSSGFWPTTKNGHFPVNYSAGNSVFVSTFNSVINSLCPVKTGYLKSSCHAMGSGMNVISEAGAPYAAYVEYGTWRMPPRLFFTIAVLQAYSAAYGAWVESYETALEQEFEYVYNDVYQQCFDNNPKQNETFAHNWATNAARVSVQCQRTYHPNPPQVSTT